MMSFGRPTRWSALPLTTLLPFLLAGCATTGPGSLSSSKRIGQPPTVASHSSVPESGATVARAPAPLPAPAPTASPASAPAPSSGRIGAAASLPVVLAAASIGAFPDETEPPAEPEDEDLLDDEGSEDEPAGDPEDPFLLIATVEEELAAGRAALAEGDSEEARQRLDAAVDLLVDLGIEPEEDHRVRLAWDGAMAALCDLDALQAQEEEEAEAVARGGHEETPAEAISAVEPESLVTPTGSPVPGAPAVAYDIPIDLNPRVLSFIEVFSGRLREPISLGLYRSGRYLPMIERVFAEEGVPLDLAWLALCESNFNPVALSRAGARGLWQFIPGTGRRYGLRIDWYVDERSDPEKATRAAARYLKDLYGMFGDWNLAMASYNSGEGRVAGAIRRSGSVDFWTISSSRRYLPTETRNYVPAIQAAIVIANDPAAHGFSAVRDVPPLHDTVTVEASTDLTVLARCAGTDAETLRALNPELRRTVTPNEPYALKIPPGAAEGFAMAWALVPAEERIPWTFHTVRKGQTLASIAGRYGVPVSTLMQANGISSPRRLSIGQSLRIPTGTAGAVEAAALAERMDRADSPGHSTGGRRVTHVVRRGETLSSIARRYGTSVSRIRSLNGLHSHRIYAGQRLVVGTRGGSSSSSRAAASSGGGEGSTKVVHTVRRGDTLSEIASHYGTSVASLRRWNRLPSNGMIRPGQKIVLYVRR